MQKANAPNLPTSLLHCPVLVFTGILPYPVADLLQWVFVLPSRPSGMTCIASTCSCNLAVFFSNPIKAPQPSQQTISVAARREVRVRLLADTVKRLSNDLANVVLSVGGVTQLNTRRTSLVTLLSWCKTGGSAGLPALLRF